MNHNLFVLFVMTQIQCSLNAFSEHNHRLMEGEGRLIKKEGFQKKTASPIIRNGFSILFFSKKTSCMNRSMAISFS